MDKIFVEKELLPNSFFQRIFRTENKYNALIEINNLLAKSYLTQINPTDIQSISDKYKVNIKNKFQTELLDFYSLFLDNCLKDNNLSENKMTELRHLENILNLDEIKVRRIFEEKTVEKYKLEVDEIVESKKLDQDQLKIIQDNLKITEETGAKIYKEIVGRYINDFVQNIISEQRYSLEKEKELEDLKKSLSLNLNFDNNTKELLDKYRVFWQIDNGDLPIETCSISLQSKEICHFIADIQWYEQRKVTQRVNYGGVTGRLKIAKGIYLRAGSISPQRITEDVWKLIDNGKLFITNKRIIFMGGLGNKTINLNKILDFNVYSNGIEISKDTGKNPFLGFEKNTDTCSLILSSLIDLEKV